MRFNFMRFQYEWTLSSPLSAPNYSLLCHDADSAAAPAAPPGFQIVQEGAARILFPDANQVFYNKPQVVNRDLSTLVIQHFIELRKREFAAKGMAAACK